MTAFGGAYAFPNLTAGTYFVRFVVPGGYSLTGRDAGSDDGRDSDADAQTGLTGPIGLPSGGASVRSVDAGLTTDTPVPPPPSTPPAGLTNLPPQAADASDPDDGPGPLEAVEQNASGTWDVSVSVRADGGYRFDPTVGFNALSKGEREVYQLRYRVSDGDASVAATALITVTGKNDAPMAKADFGFVTLVSGGLSVRADEGVLVNDKDPDRHDRLSVQPFTATTFWGATVGMRADGGFTYDPTASLDLREATAGDAVVEDWFEYSITDGHGGASSAKAYVKVSGRPPSGYEVRPVATTALEQTVEFRNSPPVSSDDVHLASVVPGASINNLGVVAFTATHVWDDGKTYSQLYSFDSKTPGPRSSG